MLVIKMKGLRVNGLLLHNSEQSNVIHSNLFEKIQFHKRTSSRVPAALNGLLHAIATCDGFVRGPILW